MGRRRRSLLLRAAPWLLALGIVGGVAHGLRLALALSDTDIVEKARSLRVGDEPNDVARDPRSALDCLQPLLERAPQHYGALTEAARAWADLRHYDEAVRLLEHAADHAPAEALAVAAMRSAVHYLIRADRFDEAIDMAAEVCSLQPANLLLPLQHGAALYNASVATQAAAVQPFMSADKGLAELAVEERIEAFVTDLWGDPDVAKLVDWLAADADSAFRDTLRTDLSYARRRFQEAADVLAAYEHYDGFDGSVAQEVCELLLRSGRLFDAYLEAALALRQPNVNLALSQNLRTVQAECAEVMQEWALAADIYQQVVDDWVAKSNWCPPRFLSALLEMRVKAEQWDWILANQRSMRQLIEDDPYIDYALAAALLGTGDARGAKEAMLTPFALISAGTSMPTSVRSQPHRRWDVLRLAVDVFQGAEDEQRALTALDRLLSAFPDDLVSRRRRITIQRSRGFLEGAVDDAFRLLVPERRDVRDFELWLSISDELSLQRHGQTLDQRARTRLDSEGELAGASVEAAFQAAQLAKRRRTGPTRSTMPSTDSFPARDPALAFAVVRERLRRNQIELARNDARHLLQAHPGVQAFRYRLGRLLVREGKLLSAVGDFRQILEQVPGDTQTLDLTLRVERALGHESQAADLTNAMILADPQGVGSVQYARLLLERGLAERAEKLLLRVLAAQLDDPSPDVLLVVARAKLALGATGDATGLLNALSAVFPEMGEVAMLGLELGLAEDKPGVVNAAINILAPQAAGLFPDDMLTVAELLLDARLYDELMRLFPAPTWELPAVRPALRHLARAAKALGRIADADRLLSLAQDVPAIRDLTLLHCLDDRPEEASRQLRLLPSTPARAAEIELCLMTASAFGGSRVPLADAPTASLRELGVVDQLSPRRLELLDAVLRILPSVKRLAMVLPQTVVSDPLASYPHAGPDVAKLLDMAKLDADAARHACRSLLALLLADGRPLWEREVQHLAELALHHVPGLAVPAVTLGALALEQGDPQRALEYLGQPLATLDLDRTALELFLQASHELGKPEWGLGLALGVSERFPEVRLILGRALLQQGYPKEALEVFEQILADAPDDVDALAGSLEVLGLQRLQRKLAERVTTVIERHPTSLTLTHAAADALAFLPQPDETSQQLMQRLHELDTQHLPLTVALARTHQDDAQALEPWLQRAGELVTIAPPVRGSEAAGQAVRALADATRLARGARLNDLARQLAQQALKLEPGNLLLFRELAELELADGHLDRARDYLEALTFIDRSDKEPPLTLGLLLSQQIGQPHLAATVIRQAYPTAKPPPAVAILAAETFLRGDTAGALALFQELRANPLVTPDMVLEVARMALAGRHDDVAAVMFNAFLTTAPKEHPGRPRALALAALCQPVPSETAESPPARRVAAADATGDQAEALAGDQAGATAEASDPAQPASEARPDASAAVDGSAGPTPSAADDQAPRGHTGADPQAVHGPAVEAEVEPAPPSDVAEPSSGGPGA